MRKLLRRLGARTGISIGLVLIVAVVLLVFRLVGERERTPYAQIPTWAPTVAATVGDDGPDDVEPERSGSSLFPDDEVVLAVASTFTAAWLRRSLSANEWLDGLRPHAAPELIERLVGVDPLDVPTGIAGEPTIRKRSDLYAEVSVPIAPHDVLVLGVTNSDGTWLITSLDRETG